MGNLWYLSPTDQWRNTGVDDYGTEAERMNQLVDLIEPHLKRCGVNYFRPELYQPIDNRPDEANAMGATHYVAFHSNGGGSLGPEVYYYSAQDLAKKFADALLALGQTNLRSSNVKEQKGFFELKYPDGIAVLIEVDYHDRSEGVRFIVDRMDEIAAALAKVIVEEDGKQWIAEGEEHTEEETIMYNTIEEVPEYAKATIQKLMDKGALQGKANGDLALSEDMLRILVIHDRMGLYGI